MVPPDNNFQVQLWWQFYQHFPISDDKPLFIFLQKEAILVINTSWEGHWSRRDPRWPIECSERSSVPCYNGNKAGLVDYTKAGIILCMRSADERRRYSVT